MNFGFIKVAASTPDIKVANCKYNTNNIIETIKNASENGAAFIVFPELCITGATCADLFNQPILIKSAEKAVYTITQKTKTLDIISVVGLPIYLDGILYNCAAVLYHGEILGITAKSDFSKSFDLDQTRHFSKINLERKITFANKQTIISPQILFECSNLKELKFSVEIGDNAYPLISNQTVTLNPVAINELPNSQQNHCDVIKYKSKYLSCSYISANSGFGESTTDLVFASGNYITENGEVIEKSNPFSQETIYSDIDIKKLYYNSCRKKNNLSNTVQSNISKVVFELPIKQTKLKRIFAKNPFLPEDNNKINERLEQILNIQSTGLATRLQKTGIENIVIGLSGGLDSTLALIVCIRAFDFLKINRKNIHAVTMPCFGTTKRTKANAEVLAKAYDVSFYDIDISNTVRSHFKDIDQDENNFDITFENAQARERTQVLMDLSNKLNALVVGTGDLSELALGFTTYNGDHMSMYGVNASVPKTLMRLLTQYEADNSKTDLKKVLKDILNTPVSPELLPPGNNGTIKQKTETVIGPYELHDFFLYYFVKYNFSPSKIYYISCYVFKDSYSNDEIKKWLTLFIKRFFLQQFKRSCLPDGPKTGSVCLSPRGSFKMPSDASVALWLDELNTL